MMFKEDCSLGEIMRVRRTLLIRRGRVLSTADLQFLV